MYVCMCIYMYIYTLINICIYINKGSSIKDVRIKECRGVSFHADNAGQGGGRLHLCGRPQ